MRFQPGNPTAFKPGKSGNPNGRPRKLKFYEIVDKILDLRIKELPPALKEAALELTDDANKTARDAGAARVVKEMFTGNQSFLKEAMDRIEGPVAQKTETRMETELGAEARKQLAEIAGWFVRAGDKTPAD